MINPKDRSEIANRLHRAEVMASEPYPNTYAAVINIIEVLKLMNKESANAKT